MRQAKEVAEKPVTGYAVHAPGTCKTLNQNYDGLGQRIQPPVFQQSLKLAPQRLDLL
jgi:hypothetical protein